MKLVLGVLLILLLLTQAYESHNEGKEKQKPKRRMGSVGMSYVAPPPTDADKFVEMIVAGVFHEIQQVHIDKYETEDGVLTNIDIKVTPPQKDGITFRYNEDEESLVFFLKQVSVLADFDMNLYYGAVRGHTTLNIDKLDMDVIVKGDIKDGIKMENIDYHLHLNEADIKTTFTAMEDPTNLPPEMKVQLGSLVGNFPTTVKLAAGDMLDKTFERRTEEVINNYFDSMSSRYTIPKKVGEKVR